VPVPRTGGETPPEPAAETAALRSRWFMVCGQVRKEVPTSPAPERRSATGFGRPVTKWWGIFKLAHCQKLVRLKPAASRRSDCAVPGCNAHPLAEVETSPEVDFERVAAALWLPAATACQGHRREFESPSLRHISQGFCEAGTQLGTQAKGAACPQLASSHGAGSSRRLKGWWTTGHG